MVDERRQRILEEARDAFLKDALDGARRRLTFALDEGQRGNEGKSNEEVYSAALQFVVAYEEAEGRNARIVG